MDKRIKAKNPEWEWTFKEGSPHLLAYSDDSGEFIHCFHMDKVPPYMCHKCEGDHRKITLAYGTKGFYVTKIRCFSCGRDLYKYE